MKATAKGEILLDRYCRMLPWTVLLVSVLVMSAPRQLFAEISDGAHGGNTHFFFLSPLVPPPNPKGIFVGSLSPVVQICECAGTGYLLPPVAEFTATTGPDADRVTVAPQEECYTVTWHPKPDLGTTQTYRIRVLFRTHEGVSLEKELGHVDVTPAAMVIKFRIEEGFFPVGELTPKERTKISPVLQRYVAAHDTFGAFQAILTLSDAYDTLGKQAGILVLREYGPTLPNAVVQIGNSDDMALLARNPKVDFISENRLYHLIDIRSQGVTCEPCTQPDGNIRIDTAAQDTPTPAQTLIGQPCAQQNGYIGTGTAVAVLDTGIDLTDPAFSGIQVISEPMDLPLNPDLRCDGDAWHGTKVAKQVAQVAPGAVLIMLDVQAVDGFIDQECGMSLDCFLRAAKWIFEHQEQYNIVAMNMSYAVTGGSYSTEECPLYWQEEMTIENLRNHGIVPFAGSGNDGLLQGVSSPACTPAVIGVAAVDPVTDVIWPDSTRGANLDFLAPGCAGSMCGTSLASPVAAGAWAVLRAARPELSLDETLELLKATGVPIYDQGTGLWFPRIQLELALGLPDCDGYNAADRDGDGVRNDQDNCPDNYNPDQTWTPCRRMPVIEIEWLDFLDRIVMCVNVPGGAGPGCPVPPPGCPECYPNIYEGSTSATMPEELVLLYQCVEMIRTHLPDLPYPADFLDDLFEIVKRVKPYHYLTAQLRNDTLEVLSGLITAKSPRMDPNTTAQLVHMLNDMELDWRAVSPFYRSLPVVEKVPLNLGGFATLEFRGIEETGTASLEISSGLPRIMKGVEPLWPILSYNLNFTGTVLKDAGSIQIKFFLGGYSFDRQIANLHVLEWDGSAYRDVTTAVDLEDQCITATTNRLGTYVISNQVLGESPVKTDGTTP